MQERRITYEDFIELARDYRKTFEYCFNPKSIKSYTNRWILLTTLTITIGVTLYISSIDDKNFVNSNFPGLIAGLAFIFSGGFFRSRFDREVFTGRLLTKRIIQPEELNLKKWQLKNIYLKRECAPLFIDINKVINEVDDIESKIKNHQEILDKIIGFTWIDNLLNIKNSGNTIIFTIGIAALGAVGGMYLSPLKEQITSFYETPVEYVMFCFLILMVLLVALFVAGMILGMLGMIIVRQLDLNDRHLSRYARSRFKRDLLMLTPIENARPLHNKKTIRPRDRYTTSR